MGNCSKKSYFSKELKSVLSKAAKLGLPLAKKLLECGKTDAFKNLQMGRIYFKKEPGCYTYMPVKFYHSMVPEAERIGISLKAIVQMIDRELLAYFRTNNISSEFCLKPFDRELAVLEELFVIPDYKIIKANTVFQLEYLFDTKNWAGINGRWFGDCLDNKETRQKFESYIEKYIWHNENGSLVAEQMINLFGGFVYAAITNDAKVLGIMLVYPKVHYTNRFDNKKEQVGMACQIPFTPLASVGYHLIHYATNTHKGIFILDEDNTLSLGTCRVYSLAPKGDLCSLNLTNPSISTYCYNMYIDVNRKSYRTALFKHGTFSMFKSIRITKSGHMYVPLMNSYFPDKIKYKFGMNYEDSFVFVPCPVCGEEHRIERSRLSVDTFLCDKCKRKYTRSLSGTLVCTSEVTFVPELNKTVPNVLLNKNKTDYSNNAKFSKAVSSLFN